VQRRVDGRKMDELAKQDSQFGRSSSRQVIDNALAKFKGQNADVNVGVRHLATSLRLGSAPTGTGFVASDLRHGHLPVEAIIAVGPASRVDHR